MAATIPVSPLFAALPAALDGLCVRVVDGDGAVIGLAGTPDATRIEGHGSGVTAWAPRGRKAFARALGSGATMVFSFATERAARYEPLLGALGDVLMEKHHVEQDVESMNLSALAMLEEISMLVDTMPKLAAGTSEQKVAELALVELVVAAGVERALYVRRQHDQCEILVQVCMDRGGRQATVVPYKGPAIVSEDDGLLWRALRSDRADLFAEVPAGGRLGAPGSPESLARRQIVVVPVRYGDGGQVQTLGALVVMDKRDQSYAHRTVLGTPETKLATQIALMLGSMLGARKRTELDEELKTAKQIQRQILPDRPPAAPGIEFAGRVKNSGAVGGDYFDFVRMSDDRTLVVVADVSGHNLASGMIMVSARATLRALAMRHAAVGRVFDDLAKSLFDDLTRTERFITAVGAMVAPRERAVELVNAGHNDSLVFRAATGAVERIPSEDTVLGFLPAPKHDVRRETLQEGDVLLLYTDGATEATAPDGRMFGEEGLERVLIASAAGSAQQILDAVLGAVDQFADKSAESDDITAVVIKATARNGEA